MMLFKHLSKYFLLFCLAQMIIMILPRSLSSIGMIFSLSKTSLDPWLSCITIIVAIGSYSYIYFKQVMNAPSKPFLCGLILYLIQLATIYGMDAVTKKLFLFSYTAIAVF